jgi:hypothetical protein
VCGCQTFDDVPPNGFTSAQNSREFCALRFGRLPEISRFDVPQKRAKLTSTSGLFRRQSGKIPSRPCPTAIKTIETGGRGAAERQSKPASPRRHGGTERNEVFYQEAMKPGRRILNISSLPFLASWFPYKFACFALVCALLVKIFVK